MLFFDNLEELIFTRHELFESDEMVILSGYVGPSPIKRLETLPLNTTVIYGMYGSEGIRKKLHNSLITLDKRIIQVEIKYSSLPIHSKCYAWKKSGHIVHALIGSANFSANGLRTPFKEVLAETTKDTFKPLDGYINTILEHSISCYDDKVRIQKEKAITIPISPTETVNQNICTMVLYDPQTGEVQNANGLNWGFSKKGNVNIDDANIPIRMQYIRRYPQLFAEKLTIPRTTAEKGRLWRHNEAIELLWDDGMTMMGLLEGNNPVKGEGKIYPKQICSFPEKRTLGRYIRSRIGVPSGQRVTKIDLERYGRTTIDVSLLGEGIYYLDFSVSDKEHNG